MGSRNRRDFLRLSVLEFAGSSVLAGSQWNKATAGSATPEVIREPSRTLPVFAEADICFLGGSCTGVFAAIRAARLGAKVVLIEKQNSFGGTATNSMVNVWHSLMDTDFEQQIIAGLTLEVIERLKKRGAVKFDSGSPSVGCGFNSPVKGRWREETKINPTFYQIPFRSLVPGKYGNLIAAGRMLDADLVAFSAVRVMVNMNQTGEAAGTAAYLALDTHTPIPALDAATIRKMLAERGSIII